MSTEAEPLTVPAEWAEHVIPGQLIHNADGTVDDIAPGVLIPFPDRTPVLHRAGSAAMVVASVTGRAVGLTAYGSLVAGGWFWAGLKAGTYLGYRYVRAKDLQEVLGGMNKSADWNKVQQVRRSRWRFLGYAAGVTAALNVAGWIALVAGAGMTALDYSWMIPPAITAAIAATATALYGRYRLNAPGLEAGQVIAEQDAIGSDEPFPLSYCVGGEQVIDCLSRALAAHGVGTRAITIVGARKWGWELDVTLQGSTPGKVMAVADDLESDLGLPDGGFMMEPDTTDKSRITTRLVQSNPFADMPAPAVHAPRSLSVHDVVVMGRTMDGSPFELTLDGFCALIIGAMGAGKTLGALRAINEALTACRDATVWDLDPIKGGLSEFGDLMSRRARTPEECEEALEEALSYVSARRHLMDSLKMGDRWYATETHPNLYINVDEFIQLSPRGKDLLVKILRTGRQYGIYLIMAGQEATADALGDAVAMLIAYRLLMACRFEDIKIAFGPGAGREGWRPDRMKPAVGPVANDAGQAMIMGGTFNRAIRYQFTKYTRDQIAAAVPARVAAGVTAMDSETLLKAGVALAGSSQRMNLADRLEAFAQQGGVDDAYLVAALLRAFDETGRGFLPTNEVLLPAIAGAGIKDIDATSLSTKLRKHAPGVKSDRTDCPEGAYLRGWRRDDVEKAAAGLLDPVETRQNLGKRAA
ncbi:hypothetical protein G6W57_00935 [Streptomyces sp. CAI-121]|uniref:hypothetical protein n=1 Tax=unclassified Streptomyces TaxID=2593676 RepID=UPI0015870372|nr:MULTISPECIES: hypothetical protein [unclassified Streptomyces]NUV65680.1 hypothetical protein [Streptomyces sp. CAI-121]NUW12417.1 hypothetical protein [Streptomyces sp. CAI-68]